MLNIHKLSVGFGGEYLFEEISFRLNAGDRVGLIGKNGAGKSTLLKLLSKDMAPDTGVIASEKDLQLGFLRQDIDFVQGRTVLEEAQQAFEEIKSLELQLDEVNHQLATRTDYESDAYSAIIEDLSDLTHRYELIGGYNYQGETEKILQGLGFKRADFDKKTETFSGGWRMRIELAKLLLQTNDVLLLDEPTAGINTTLINGIIDRLIKVNQDFGITLLVIEHNMKVIMSLAQKIFCLAHGKMLAEGSPDQIKNDKRVVDAYLGAQ
mgnify:CR=1 FL=1